MALKTLPLKQRPDRFFKQNIRIGRPGGGGPDSIQAGKQHCVTERPDEEHRVQFYPTDRRISNAAEQALFGWAHRMSRGFFRLRFSSDAAADVVMYKAVTQHISASN